MVDIEEVKRSCNPTSVASRYHLEKERGLAADYEVSREVLGRGACGDVVAARRREDGRRCALKRLNKRGSASKVRQHAVEVETHLSIDHPNVARVLDVYDSESSIALVTECCEGGELYAALQERGTFPDAAAAETARQMLRVVKHLHLRSIVHRDLKLENFLYMEKDPVAQMDRYLDDIQAPSGEHLRAEAPQLKLIDFGFARVWDAATLMRTSCGSAEYVSPDVLSGAYTNKCDLWSIGVIVWMLLTGYPPFHGEKRQMIAKIKSAHADWSSGQGRWSGVCQDAKDFVRQLLVKDPEQRPEAGAALDHPWLISKLPTMDTSLAYGRILSAMRRYAASSKLRRAAVQLVVQQLDERETRELRTLFHRIDERSEGWISAQEFVKAIRRFEHASNEDGYSETPEEIFAAIATSSDQRIYYSDFLAATAVLHPRRHKRSLKVAFARVDVDKCGSIGADHLCAALGDTFEGACVREMLLEASPQSGEVSYHQFVEAVTLSSFVEEVEEVETLKCDVGGARCGLDVFAGRLGLISRLLAM